jgi:hypothetical protein
MKTNILKLKEDIKALSAEQKVLKVQRKTTKETYNPKARYKHSTNRWDIFHMLIVYAKLRGREDRMRLKEDTIISKSYVDKLLIKYSEEVIRVDQK